MLSKLCSIISGQEIQFTPEQAEAGFLRIAGYYDYDELLDALEKVQDMEHYGMECRLVEYINTTFKSDWKVLTTPKVDKPFAAPKPDAPKNGWNDPLVKDARQTRHGCEVFGIVYDSVKKAFEALDLPLQKHVKFRAGLKAAGTATFVHEGKDYIFNLVEKD